VSREELVSAFLEGRLSRRTLVRRLVAGGVSVGAAVSYAQLLKPERAFAESTAAVDELYPLVLVTITSNDLDVVINDAVVRATVSATEEIGFARFWVFFERPSGLRLLGIKTYSSNFLAAAGQRNVNLQISPTKLEPFQKATIWVHLQAFDSENAPGLAAVSKQISR
jgi:hypothetical protein